MDKISLIGDKFNTSLGECIVLDVNPKYLILFNGERFIKANGYNYSLDDEKIYWSQGEYYDSLSDFMELKD